MKVPLILPLLINNNLEADFKRKADHFNNFFASKCTPLKNDSVLPTLLEHDSEARFSKISFPDDQILKILRALDINKAHGHDEISIRMLKLYDKSIIPPLSLMFQNCIDTRTFPDTWKKSNIVSVHRKGDKQIVDNYRPVSLSPILVKIFERIIFNSIFEYLEENNLLCPNLSGFRPSDYCEYQLLSILHEIYKSFDCNPPKDVRGIFLDLSKAFDSVWHDGLIFKINRIGITGNSLNFIESFLSNRFQRVVLNGQSSSWTPVNAGVPQGSILGPLFFLIYINDLSKDISSTVKLFANDTSIFSVVDDVNVSVMQLNNDLLKISKWAYQWKMSFNPDISEQAQEIIFSRKSHKPAHPPVIFNNVPVKRCSIQKRLGIHLDEKLNFNHHVKEKITKANKGIGVIKKLSNTLPRDAMLTIYQSFVRPHLDYGDIIYDQPQNESFCNKLESIQYNAALAITGAI